MAATLRRMIVFAAALAIAGAAMGMATGALAAPVEPLKPEDCDKVRRGLEVGLPFGPGFRRLEFAFPKNDRGVEGRVCRLLTLGTGVHMESGQIRSLQDMRAQLAGALRAAGWAESADTARFAQKSSHGREVFALQREDAICVVTIVVGVVEGAEPGPAAMADGKVRIGRLKPHQREWWLSVDCFQLEAPKPMPAAEAAPEAPMGMPAETPEEPAAQPAGGAARKKAKTSKPKQPAKVPAAQAPAKKAPAKKAPATKAAPAEKRL